MQSAADNAFIHTQKKIAFIQVGLVLSVAIIAALVKSKDLFLATLYGGAIIIASTGYFGWRLRIATQTGEDSPAVNTVVLFKGIILRFVLVISLLALGMGWLKLSPVGILLGFIVAQLAFWFSRTSYGVTRRK